MAWPTTVWQACNCKVEFEIPGGEAHVGNVWTAMCTSACTISKMLGKSAWRQEKASIIQHLASLLLTLGKYDVYITRLATRSLGP